MEVRVGKKTGYKWATIYVYALLLLYTQLANAQPPIKSYTIKDGKMYITVSKHLYKTALDSFIIKYDLYDLDLPNFIKTGSPDSLKKLGWLIDIINKEIFVISKPIIGFENINNPAERILFTEKINEAARFAVLSNQAFFGANRFKNKSAFATADSVVTFYLRGNTRAAHVTLAGSFNKWQPEALPMFKTDSGWVANVTLSPGKYWYKFVVDGDWRVDKDNNNIENDGRGNDNSVYFKTNYVFNLNGYTQAKKVYLSGSFNNWKEKELSMDRTQVGWSIPVYLSEGTHTYRFIADGNWLTDPANADKLPNEFNDFNSVIRMGKPYIFRLDGFTSAKKIVVLGSFNNWKDDELFMNKTATGWELPYTLGPGNYAYKLKIDGKATADQLTKGDIVLVIDPNYIFRLKGFENAKSVCISGDFNNWSPSSFQMKKEGTEWILKTHLNKGKHRYKFVVDGKWILDPANKLWEQNEYNTGNSVLWIEND
jgi:hypothetical protein